MLATSGRAPRVSESAVSQATGTAIGDMINGGGLAAAFDSTTNQAGASCARKSTSTTAAYIGKTYSPTKACTKVEIYGSNDFGYQHTGTPSITINLRGKAGAAPSSETDGTLLGTISFTETDNESSARTITSSDSWTKYDHIFVEIPTIPTNDHFVAELVIYENTNA